MKQGKTLANIVDSIIEYMSAFVVTDDNRLDRDIIADKVHEVRQNLIHDEFRSNGYVADEYYVLTKCIKIIKEDMTCDEVDKCANLGLNVWVAEIPVLMERVGWSNIKYLGTVNFTKKLTRTSLSGFLSHAGASYTSHKPVFTMIENGRLMFNNVDCLEVLNMLALPKVPTSVCDWEDDRPYPVPDSFKLELIVKQDLGHALGIPADELNNTRDDRGIPQPQKQTDE